MAPPNSDIEMLLHNFGSTDRAKPALIAIALLAIILRKRASQAQRISVT